MRTLRVGGRDKVWDLPFCEVFDVFEYRFHRDGKGFQGAERSNVQDPEKLVARQTHLPFQDSPNDDQVQTRPQPCVQHGIEWQYQLAVEWSHDQRGA